MFPINNVVFGFMLVIAGFASTVVYSFNGEFILEQPTLAGKILATIRKFWTIIFIVIGLYIMGLPVDRVDTWIQ
jgi:hypothetical protein